MAKGKKLKFSPSHSYRWLNCPGSLQLCATLPEPESSKFAREGTAAHELAANCLKMDEDAAEWIGETIEVEDDTFKVTETMAENVQIYLDAVRDDLDENAMPLSELFVERKFKIAVGDTISGTNDAGFSTPLGKLYIYDLKYGAGTYVEVKDNPQLMIYAAGAMAATGWVNEVAEIVIAQPRYNVGEVLPVRRQEILKDTLLDFMADVTVAIKKCKDKKAKCVPGAWCDKSFCPARGVCPALSNKVVEATGLTEKRGVLEFPDPAKLKPEQIAKVLQASNLISGWVKGVHSYAKTQAEDLGVKIPGYKLIRKYGNRAWVDEMAVETEFESELGDEIYDKKLKSPAKLEKLAGKERVAALVTKPYKGTDLVTEDARGEEVLPEAHGVFKKIEGGDTK